MNSADNRTSYRIAGATRGVIISGIALLVNFGGMTATALAGDLLRGGFTQAQSGSTNPGSFTPPSVTQARNNANDILARTTQAIQAVTAMQSKARSLAVSSGANNLGINPNNTSQTLPNVPNGLGTGGLNPVGGVTVTSGVTQVPAAWTGISSLGQTQSADQTLVTITQNSPDAVLTWQTFNVGRQTTLDFNQNAGGSNESKWIAFNIIEDPSLSPTQILGAINAGGQVYVINQNGIIFGGSSQVNVHTLVASSLPIDTYLIGHGLLNNPDDQFLFSALAQPAGTNGSPAMAAATGDIGDVTVQAGAQIISPANVENVGGRVALIGANVTNNGTISTPDGQTILAAGLQVGLAAHASDDPTLRGLDVYVGAVTGASTFDPTAGTAINDGDITVPEGDAFIAGKEVEQLGVIDSTTSVTLNGRIDLDASYGAITSGGAAGASFPFLPQSTGTVILGDGSVTQILPDWGSSDTVNLSQFSLESQVNIEGLAIHLAGDATVFAPSGTVNVEAGTWSYFVQSGVPEDSLIHSEGQIYLDSNAAIDVQGSWDVSVPVSQNIVAVQLLGPELEDSPLQRDGVFRGQTIYVDARDTGVYDGEVWQGTPLADASGYIGLIQYGIGELTTAGGTVNLDAGASVVLQPGSQVNVSAGWVDYQGGVVQTCEVISAGHIYPISEATPNLVYQGFNFGTFTADELKYNVSQTYTDPLINTSTYEASYVEGNAGGALNITAPETALDGQMIGLSVIGPRQLDGTKLPISIFNTTPSAINLSYETEGAPATEGPSIPPAIVFATSANLPTVAPFTLESNGDPEGLSDARQKEVILSPDLVESDGFGSLTISDQDGNITMPAGISMTTQPGGSITFAAANINIGGSLTAPGGSLVFSTFDFDPLSTTPPTTTPAYNPARGNFTLGGSAVLDTAGLIIDDRPYVAGADTQQVVTGGGSVSITSLVTKLDGGSEINVSGGVEMQASGTPAYGNGGSISIKAGEDSKYASIPGGELTMDATLLGYSGATGGSLSVHALLVQVGGPAINPGTLLLDPGFFSEGGFEKFSLTGIGEVESSGGYIPAVDIAANAQIDPVETSEMVVPGSYGSGLALEQVLLPVGERPAVDLSFSASGLTDSVLGTPLVRGDILMGEGSIIRTDPLGTVSFSGQTVAILGSIYAPGGSISLNAGGVYNLLAGSPQYAPTLEIGPQSVISAAGTALLIPDVVGSIAYQTGKVLPGGSISVSGNIIAEAGAVLDVSGATATLDVSPYDTSLDGNSTANTAPQDLQNGSLEGTVLEPAEVDSNGGQITLAGIDILFTDATLRGAAGGPSAVGGSLTVSSGLTNSSISPNEPSLTVTQGVMPFSTTAGGPDGLGKTVVNTKGTAINPSGYFAVDNFLAGGFSSLTLRGSVGFDGNVDINAPGSLIIATGGVIESTGHVTLAAPYVDLGQVFGGPLNNPPAFVYSGGVFAVPPTYGSGDLTVIADLIDIGNLSLQGIGNATFIAQNGAIRGDGTLDVAGNILMEAGQVYPPTETTFNIAAYDYTANGNAEQGKVTFVADGSQETPLSAGGSLNVYASIINQDGVLHAPDGTINLGWNGTGTAPIDPLTGAAFDTSQKIVLGASSITSVSEINSLTGEPLIIPYGINYNGTSWIDPGGQNITTTGAPAKAVNISAANVVDEKGSIIDIRGGGDLMSYEFIPGVQGNNDILASQSSFAIIPGYEGPLRALRTVQRCLDILYQQW